MYFQKSYDWVKIALWVGVVVALIAMIYAVSTGYLYLAIAALLVMIALLAVLGYCKYAEVMAVRRKFVVVQETFTTLMLVYFSYAYFTDGKTLPGEKQLNGARKKFDAVYDKSRVSLTMPLVMTALKTFGELKNIKDIVISEVKNFSSFDGFNLDNAENLTTEIGKLATKLGQMGDIIGKGWNDSKKTIDDIADDARIGTKALRAPDKKTTGRTENKDRKKRPATRG